MLMRIAKAGIRFARSLGGTTRYVFTYLNLRSNPQGYTTNVLAPDTTVTCAKRVRTGKVYHPNRIA
jgi:hypothetical protein